MSAYNASPRRKWQRMGGIPDAIVALYAGLATNPRADAFDKAVAKFQRDHDLNDDGCLGPKTWSKMVTVAATAHVPDTIVDSETGGVPVSIWLGWTKMRVDRLRELREAGASEVVVNMNDAGMSWSDARKGLWKWSPELTLVERHIQDSIAAGYKSIVLMPWVWMFPRFIETMAKECAALTSKYADYIKRWELNCEGSGEKSGQSITKRTGKTPMQVVAEALAIIAQHKPEDVELSTSILHFQRPYGNALLRSDEVTMAIIEAYSISKFHQSKLQPGAFQHTAYDEYVEFKIGHDVSSLRLGVPMWAQKRGKAPAHLRLTPKDAVRKSSQAALDVGCDGVQFWAAHLFDDAKEALYYDLALREIEFLTGGKQTTEAQSGIHISQAPQGYNEFWNSKTGKRVPEGFRKLPRPISRVPNIKAVRDAAKMIRSLNNDLGTTTMFDVYGARYIAQDELHSHTYRDGVLVHVPGGIHGITVYQHSTS